MNKTTKSTIRCAIYSRKSSEEGLDLEFNSLDAQREAAEAFIASQKAEGWVALPARYDDGGYSGGSMERPALDRLLKDIASGGVDCVVVYKVDRLSRSLLDFARIMETFDKHKVSFVSVTQQFNTTHSMGRLTLNILLSFAQFEREIIGERIRDKLAAQARKGKWTGGAPILGYDVDRSGPSPKLAINTPEAQQVKEIFHLYEQHAALLPVVRELAERGWVNKSRITKKGKHLGGRPFDKASLHALLTNPLYVGKMRYKDELHPGEHEAIIPPEVFDRVQRQLKHNGRTGGAEVRNKYGALLRGLLRCRCCDSTMTHTFTSNNRQRMYRYYRCNRTIQSGQAVCSTGNLPASEIERMVIDEIHGLARDESLLKQVLEEAHATLAGELKELRQTQNDLTQQRERHHGELQKLTSQRQPSANATNRMAALHEQLLDIDQRLPTIEERITELVAQAISDKEARTVFSRFDDLWNNLTPREQARLLNLLIEKVEYDGKAGTVSVTFRPTSIRTLINHQLEQAA